MKTGIYMIRNKVNDKKYIGQAVDIDKRWGEHRKELNNNKHCNKHLQNSWNKYGEDNFKFTIIHECDEELLDDLEIMYIEKYDSFNNGYNQTLGGGGTRGYKFTEEQYKKFIEVCNKPERRNKLSKSLKSYYSNPDNIKKLSENTKKGLNRPEIRLKMKEIWDSPEWREKQSQRVKAYYSKPENREKHKVAMNRPEVREKHKATLNRPEVRKKISEATKEAMNRPEVRSKYLKATNNPEVNERRSKSMKENWNKPEYKKRVRMALKESWNKPGAREKRSAAMNRPEVKEKHRAAVKAAMNRPEVKSKIKETNSRPEVKERRSKSQSKPVYCVTNNTIYASTHEAEEKLLGKITGGTVSWACQGKYGSGNGHIYKKLGLEFWFLDEWEEKQRQYEQLPPLLKLQLKYEQAYKKAVM